MVQKNKNGACCDENNIGSEVEVSSCKKLVLDGAQITSLLTNHKWLLWD